MEIKKCICIKTGYMHALYYGDYGEKEYPFCHVGRIYEYIIRDSNWASKTASYYYVETEGCTGHHHEMMSYGFFHEYFCPVPLDMGDNDILEPELFEL